MDSMLIHIGYHKTGSTWLQNDFFIRPETGFSLVPNEKMPVRSLSYRNALDFDAEAIAREFQPGLDQIRSKGKIPVISSERLSGNYLSGGYDSKELADRLHATFPDARILIVIREQVSMILSSYIHYIRRGGACSLRDYFLREFLSDHMKEQCELRLPHFRFAHFLYHRLIKYYQHTFSSEKVLVLPFELMSRDLDAFLAEIVSFAEAANVPAESDVSKANAGLRPVHAALQRHVNPFVRRDAVNAYSPLAIRGLGLLNHIVSGIDRLVPDRLQLATRERWRSEVAAIVEGYYCSSNQETARVTGLDLANLGYQT